MKTFSRQEIYIFMGAFAIEWILSGYMGWLVLKLMGIENFGSMIILIICTLTAAILTPYGVYKEWKANGGKW